MSEVVSPNLERARRFYSDLFGWKVDADPSMGATGVECSNGSYHNGSS